VESPEINKQAQEPALRSDIWTQELTLSMSVAIILSGFVQRTISIHILLQIFSPPIISAGFFYNSLLTNRNRLLGYI